MSSVFADTHYYLALLNRNDAAHEQAVRLSHLVRAQIVTTSWVITELADAMAHVARRGSFLALLEALENDPAVSIVPPDKDIYDAGLGLYARRPDKDWSLTDCISFVVMERLGLNDALTADTHFRQAGFNPLLY